MPSDTKRYISRDTSISLQAAISVMIVSLGSLHDAGSKLRIECMYVLSSVLSVVLVMNRGKDVIRAKSLFAI